MAGDTIEEQGNKVLHIQGGGETDYKADGFEARGYYVGYCLQYTLAGKSGPDWTVGSTIFEMWMGL